MVVCLFSACNDDDDDKIPQGPAITYAGKLPSRIGDYTFVYDDNNRCTQVKKILTCMARSIMTREL